MAIYLVGSVEDIENDISFQIALGSHIFLICGHGIVKLVFQVGNPT